MLKELRIEFEDEKLLKALLICNKSKIWERYMIPSSELSKAIQNYRNQEWKGLLKRNVNERYQFFKSHSNKIYQIFELLVLCIPEVIKKSEKLYFKKEEFTLKNPDIYQIIPTTFSLGSSRSTNYLAISIISSQERTLRELEYHLRRFVDNPENYFT